MQQTGYPTMGRQNSMNGRMMGNRTAFGASQILPSLYLGSYDDAMSVQQLQSLGITHVLNVANDCPVPHGQYQQANIRAQHLQIEDCDDVTIGSYVAQGVPFMNQAISSGGKVFVHCRYGVSRSSMMVIAYLMQHGSDGFRGMGYNEALNFTRARRPQIDPNPGFVAQLRAMDPACGGMQQQYFPGQTYANTPRGYGSSAIRARTSASNRMPTTAAPTSGLSYGGSAQYGAYPQASTAAYGAASYGNMGGSSYGGYPQMRSSYSGYAY